MNEIKMIPIDKLSPHKNNPRKNLGDLTELADSIRTNGIMQNLTVVPSGKAGYTVIIGHRRLEAARLAGITELPCAVVEMDDRQQMATMLLENIQRSDLTVWEQAKGFQMMLDLGDTVDGISEKTGFSKSTIHRRLKIAELDEKAYKESEGRQVTLEEYLNLSSIEDVNQRNKLLKSIGTNNFDWEYKQTIQEQKANKAMEPILPVLAEKNIGKLNGYEYTYRRLKTFSFDEFTPDLLDFDETFENLYYKVNPSGETVSIYTDPQNVKKDKNEDRTPEQKELEKKARKAIEDMKRLNATAYSLRKDFALGLRLTVKNTPLILRGAVVSGIFKEFYDDSAELLDEAFPISDDEKPTKDIYGNERKKRFLNKLTENPKMAPWFVYIQFGDKDTYGYATSRWVHGYQIPTPVQNSDRLDALYEWLISLGYEMSDEEKALRDGTHEILHRFDGEIAAEEAKNESEDNEDDIDEDDEFEDEELEEEDPEDN